MWEDGAPIVKHVPLLTPAVIKDVHTAALAELYSSPDDELAIEMGLKPSKYHGRTLLEVMILKRAEHAARNLGDPDVVEKILDRELGKPKTTAEIHSVSETYDQALKRIAKETDAERVAAAKPIIVIDEFAAVLEDL